MGRILKVLFFGLVVRPLVFVILGLNIRGREKLPADGPAIIAANHNSHLDTMVLMSLYPLSRIHKIRPVAAADYFLSNKILAWISLNVIGIIPIRRSGFTDPHTVFAGCHEALGNGDILVIFPEGSRGNPEQMSTLKKGIHRILRERQDTDVTPVVLHGLGRALPRGEALLVPFNCDVIVGDSLRPTDNALEFIDQLSTAFEGLFEYCITRSEAD